MPFKGEHERMERFTQLLNVLEDLVDIDWSLYPEALLGVEWATIRNDATDKWETFPLPVENNE